MRGLLTKEYYLILKTCKSYLLIILPFLLISLVAPENGMNFFMFYPTLMVSMIPNNLLTSDEKSRWNTYCAALPYRRSQMVSAKYICTFLLVLGMTLICIIAHLLRMAIVSDVTSEMICQSVSMQLTYFSAGIICPAITLPILYKFGVEKGRPIYLIAIVVVCILTGSISAISSVSVQNTFSLLSLPHLPEIITSLLGVLIAAILFGFSWFLSTVFYKKREF